MDDHAPQQVQQIVVIRIVIVDKSTLWVYVPKDVFDARFHPHENLTMAQFAHSHNYNGIIDDVWNRLMNGADAGIVVYVDWANRPAAYIVQIYDASDCVQTTNMERVSQFFGVNLVT